MSLGAEMPEGWMQQRLGECADQRTEKTLPDAANTRRYLALDHLAQGRGVRRFWAGFRRGGPLVRRLFFIWVTYCSANYVPI